MRDRILARVRSALAGREAVAHPGAFVGSPPAGPVIEAFAERFRAVGGEVERFAGMDEALELAKRIPISEIQQKLAEEIV